MAVSGPPSCFCTERSSGLGTRLGAPLQMTTEASMKGFCCSSQKLLPLNKTGWSEKVLPDTSRWATVHKHGSLSTTASHSGSAFTQLAFQKHPGCISAQRGSGCPLGCSKKDPRAPLGQLMCPPASPQDVTSRTSGKFTITRQWPTLCLPCPPEASDLKKVGQNGDLPTRAFWFQAFLVFVPREHRAGQAALRGDVEARAEEPTVREASTEQWVGLDSITDPSPFSSTSPLLHPLVRRTTPSSGL